MSDLVDTALWRAAIQTVSLSLFRFRSVASRLWVLGQMGAARLSFQKIPEARFWKLCGSGTGEGFTPVPNTQVWAILAVWDDEETAKAQVEEAAVFRRWRTRASESWTVFLAPSSVRGHWSGQTPFAPGPESAADGHSGPLAALTRATIKPSTAAQFWRRVPDISSVIGADPNVMFKIGIGEVPLLHQVTFSIWPDADTMAAFARDRNGPHGQAIQAVRDGNWFREELYARFAVTDTSGTWGGRDPLALSERSAA